VNADNRWRAFINWSVVSQSHLSVSAGRAAGSGRPVAAVGAVRRPEWSNANGSSSSGGGVSTAANEEVLADTSAQCRPFPMMSGGVPYGGSQASMLIADGDTTLPTGSSLLLNSASFLPPTMTDDALLASLTAANNSALYPVDGEWHCPHSMRSRVFVLVQCPSVLS